VGDILLSLYYKVISKSVGERILKIECHLTKLEAKIILFSGHGVDRPIECFTKRNMQVLVLIQKLNTCQIYSKETDK